MSNDPTVKRWTAKRKAAVIMDIFKDKATIVEVARQYELTVSGGLRPPFVWADRGW